MTRDDVKKLLMTTQAYFPNYRVESKSETINAWYLVLKDMDADEIMQSFLAYVNENNSAFAPSISQLVAPSNIRKKRKELLQIQDTSNVALIATSAVCKYRIYKPMDITAMLEMFGLIEAYYSKFEYDEEKAEIWLELFADCDYHAIMYCLDKYAKTNSFPPAPAGILTLYSEGKEKLKQGMQYEYDTVYQELYEVIHRDKIEENVAMFKFTVGQISEMDRLQVTQRIVRDLRQHLEENAEKYRNEEFNFEEWLKENF